MAKKKALATYRKKRDFSKTAEPSGEGAVAPSDRLRFVVQKHAARRLHYDLRLELDGVFKSWAVTRGPSDDPADKRLAVEVEDHPLDYGDFEGTIPAGEYGGGAVQLWDRGYWTPEGSKSPEEALRTGDLKFTLEGKRLHGSWVLVRMRNDRTGGKRTNWLLIKHRDASARSDGGAALLADDRSVASGRPMQQIAAGKGRAPAPFMLGSSGRAKADAVWRSNRSAESAPAAAPAAGRGSVATPAKKLTSVKKLKGVATRRIPDFVEPQLSRLVEHPPIEANWGHEVKFDGYRLQLRVVDGKVTLLTRSALDWTSKFSSVAADATGFPDCMIDGEVVALDEHRVPSFSALQAALSAGESKSLVFFAFDLLFEGREDLRGLPLVERKARLEKLLESSPGEHIRFVSHLESPGDTVLESACKMGLEGIVSKQLDAPYSSGRGDSWRKAKCRAGHEVVLGGWTTEAGTLRALLAGVNREGHLVYVGRIGTGYTRKTIEELLPKLKALTVEQSPFGGENAPPKNARTRAGTISPRFIGAQPDHVRVFYLSTSPELFVDICGRLGHYGLNEGASRVVLEKPIGHDLASAEPDQRRGRQGLRRIADLPHRPLPRQGDGAEPAGAALRQRAVRAAVERRAHRPRADHRGRNARRRRSRRVLRPRRRAARHGAEPHAAAAVHGGDGAAVVAGAGRGARREAEGAALAASPSTTATPRSSRVRGQYRAGVAEGSQVPGYPEELGKAPVQHRNLRRAEGRDRQLALGRRAVLPAHRQAPAEPRVGDRGHASSRCRIRSSTPMPARSRRTGWSCACSRTKA